MTAGASNTVTATSANAVNTIQANAAGASNVIQATNTTGFNTITAGASNTMQVTAASSSNNILANATGGINNITANNTTGTNNIEARTNNIGVLTPESHNTIGNTGTATYVDSYGGTGYTELNNLTSTMGTDAAVGTRTTGGMVQTNATTATIRASNSGTLATNSNTGIMAVGAGGGYTTYNSSQNTGTNTIANIVDNKLFTNKVNGNLFVDGNVYINGTLDYVSSNSANTTVVGVGGGSSILKHATVPVSAGTALKLKGSAVGTQTVVNNNGKLTNISGTAAESTASLTLTNGLNKTHGIVVTETQTTMSGGTHSSSMTLDDSGATFSNSATGAPVKVTGVADGTNDFDAVNFRQLRKANVGIASVSALAAIPSTMPGKKFAIGAGYGHFEGENALAIGIKASIGESISVTVGGGMGVGQSTQTFTTNAGVSYSF